MVTGGAGFLGSNLVGKLIDKGHDVIVLDDFSSGHHCLVHERATLIEGSVTDDESLSRSFIHKPEYVFHLAAQFANQNSVDHPDKDLITNGLGVIKVFDWCKKSDVKKVLNTSSSCVYGNQEKMDENVKTFYPDTPYAITKLLGEYYAKFWAEHHEVDIVTVRLFNVFGPGEFPGDYRNVIPNFISLALQGKPLVITGSGDETRDFTYVDDAVAGMCKVLFGKTFPGDVFNIASGRKTKIIEIAEIINSYLKNENNIIYKPRRNWDSVINRQADIKKITSQIGYSPEADLVKSVQKTCDWMSENIGPEFFKLQTNGK